jgi:hypothetical protein
MSPGDDPRAEVVHLFLEQHEWGVTLTPGQQALVASVTEEERRAADDLRAAEFDVTAENLRRLLSGQATDEEEQMWDMMPADAIYEGLPEPRP